MSIWFTEELHPYYRKGVRVKRVLADEQTRYQHLQFVETEFFGNAMILDGIIQLTERDNMGYHEMIVHVPMLAVGQPKRVLIVGGGDGGSLTGKACTLLVSITDINREIALEHIQNFMVIIFIVLSFMIVYTKHFVQNISDPVHILNLGFRKKDYNLLVKIPEDKAEHEIFRLAKFYNDAYLPAKMKRNEGASQKENKSLSMKDLMDFK